jgi:hypothetical protein
MVLFGIRKIAYQKTIPAIADLSQAYVQYGATTDYQSKGSR